MCYKSIFAFLADVPWCEIYALNRCHNFYKTIKIFLKWLSIMFSFFIYRTLQESDIIPYLNQSFYNSY